MPEHTHSETTSTSTSTASADTATATTSTEPQDLVGNQAIVDVIKAENNENTSPEADPNKTGIVHVGMNKYARDEANTLNRANRDRGGAIGIRNQRTQDHYIWNGVDYDLTSVEDAARFVATLGMPAQQAVNAVQWIVDGGSEAKDEMAQMVRVWSEAELGIRKMERVVLSGHSVGSEIWGDDNGEISFAAFIELSGIFPKAVAQVKHVMLSACYGGGEANMDQYHEMFPNLDSVWAYHGSSPGTWSGAMTHMKKWEAATEPGDEAGGVDPDLVAGTRKAKNVSTWNADDGYQGGEPITIGEIETQLSDNQSVFDDHFAGTVEVTDTQNGPLRGYYNIVQRYLQHPDGSDRATYTARRDVTIRLIFWGVVRGKFAGHYKSEMEAGYAEMGVDMPDLSSIGRGDFMAHFETVKGLAGSGQDALSVIDLLRRGMKDLKPEIIPSTWV
ncbi:MAG TPA: hypothetical protein QGF58_00660 [Myxococcota bacterium]|nr:hypothetical protein [Myxococcota bacterium]